jgi:CelD/BcsL family acetyltransferase involved in cellulose biosynthesis
MKSCRVLQEIHCEPEQHAAAGTAGNGMAIAITCHSQEQAAPEEVSGEARIARVVALEDMARAEPVWRRLESGRPLATAYQRFDVLAEWQQHVGARSGITPFIVIGSDQGGQPLFLWPFGLARKGSLRIARFLGSKHSNFNLGLWRRDVLPLIGEDDIRGIWRELRADIDLLVLCNQPLTWDGASNPFLLLPHQASVDMSARLSLRGLQRPIDTILSTSMRSRLRNKERKLAKQRGYRYIQATTAADIDRLLDSFFTLKAGHMAAQGLANVFIEPGVAEFVRAACHRKLANGRPLIEIHALEVSAEVLALFGTIIDGYRCSSMFNTYTLSDNARHSPGLILLEYLVNECGRRGVQSFDIGVGRAQYKSFFCPEPEPPFDSFVPLTPRARVAAAGFSAVFAAKRTIKQSRMLWTGVQMMRRVRAVTQ